MHGTTMFLCCGIYAMLKFRSIIWCNDFFRKSFWPSGIVVACVCMFVYQSRAFPRDSSSLFKARIANFGPVVHNTLVKIPIVINPYNSSPIQGAPILDQRCNILWSRSLCFGGDWPRLFHALKSQYVYLSRQPRVFPRLTLLLLDYVKL